MIQPSRCPICDRELPVTSPGQKSYVPFCSERCQLVDFHRWWQGKYAVVNEADLENLPPDALDDEGAY